MSIILISYTTPIHFYTKQFAPSVFTDNWILKKNIPVQNNLALASSWSISINDKQYRISILKALFFKLIVKTQLNKLFFNTKKWYLISLWSSRHCFCCYKTPWLKCMLFKKYIILNSQSSKIQTNHNVKYIRMRMYLTRHGTNSSV